MKNASVILLSLGLTLLLIGLNASLRQSRKYAPADSASGVKAVTNTVKRLIRYRPTPPPPPPPPPQFNWGMVESEDYATYIANLRGIGCPEKTIRDIILADVEKFYDSKHEALDDERGQKFWQTGEEVAAANKRFEVRSLELDREKYALIKSLLGVDVDAESEKTWQNFDFAAVLLGYLPEAKAERVVALYLRNKRLTDVQQTLTGGIIIPADLTEQEKTFRSIRTQLGQILTAQEIEELRFRLSVIDRSKSGTSTEMTGGELRQYAQIVVNAHDPLRELFELHGEVTDEQQQLADRKMADDVLKLLGNQRFADYQRDQDDRFREVFTLTEQNQLPKSTAIKLYDIRQAVDTQAKQTRDDPTLSDEERGILLEVLRAQTEKAFARYLGPKVFAEYQKTGVHWLDQLKFEPRTNPPPPGN